MRAEILPEPELEFGGGGRHIDPRFGITNYGPADLADEQRQRPIRIGLVGPGDDLHSLRSWLERCRDPIPAKGDAYPHLFTGFPGCDIDTGLLTTLVLSDRATNPISSRALAQIDAASGPSAIALAVEHYAQEAALLAEQNRVDVIVIARPPGLADSTPRRHHDQTAAAGAATAPRTADPELLALCGLRFANFHDVLKARLINLGVPIQIIRRSTWDETTPPPPRTSRQDEATRAWNLHVALHYKAGGVPWRLLRDSRDLDSCYVGVSFFQNERNNSLDTAVAQVFNERGDGVIVRGGTASRSGDDRQPHLTESAAHALLSEALDTYRREHRHMPARAVLHKTSSFTDEETCGLHAAAQEREVEELDLTWVTHSEGARLYRRGVAPPLRGTHLELNPTESVLYTKGSVDFYSTYPGAHVPQPIGLRHRATTRGPSELAAEVLALTKMNWNQTRLDGLLPVTLRTAIQVRRILRFCDPQARIATRYAHYM